MAECKAAHELPIVNFQNAYQQQPTQQHVADRTWPICEPTTPTGIANTDPQPAQEMVTTTETVYENHGLAMGRPALPQRNFTASQAPPNPAPESKKRWICVYILLSLCLFVLVVVGAVAIYALLRTPETIELKESTNTSRSDFDEQKLLDGQSAIIAKQDQIFKEQVKVGEKLDRERKDLLYRLPGANCLGVEGEGTWNSTIGSKRTIYPPGFDRGVDVYCDSADGGGWIVLQHRPSTGTVYFDLNWNDYENGFGNEYGYWMGLKKMHDLTSDAEYELRIDLEDWCGRTAYAVYSDFYIESESTSYALKISGYNGTAGDSLSSSNDRAFSTYSTSSYYCSSRRRSGGWWFDDSSYCLRTNLNGQFYSHSSLYYPNYYYSTYNRCSYYNPSCYQCLRSSSSPRYGIFWSGFSSGPGVLKATKMKMRLKPASFN